MMDLTNRPDFDFESEYPVLEDELVAELENLIYNRLVKDRFIRLNDQADNEIEFLQRTTYKIMVRRPNKHVWSVPLPELRNAIRKAIRKGRPWDDQGNLTIEVPSKPQYLPKAIAALLQAIPEEEYQRRSLVGNRVVHNVYGEGVIQSITDTGNVEIVFKDKVALLKPRFFRLVS